MIRLLKKILDKIFRIYFWRFGLVDFDGKKAYNVKPLNITKDFIYAADPFFIDENNILFEGIKWKNLIGKIYLYNNSKIKEISFEDKFSDFHMSFPFVYSLNGSKHIIPQISNLNSLVSFKLDLKNQKPIFKKFY